MVRAVVVTGASRGFGRAVAVDLATRWPGSHFVLTARDPAALLETRRLMLERSASSSVCVQALDVSELSGMKANMAQLLASVPADHSSLCLVNNAGTLGPLQRITDCTDPAAIQAHMALNVTSPMVLCALAIQKAAATGTPLTIVNVSSLAAVQPFDCWASYCTNKAARDMFHRCIAEEAEQAGQDVRVLNYAPGPLDTEMQAQIRDVMPDVPLRSVFDGMHKEGKLLTAEESAHTLGLLLQEDSYKTGSHVDFYDVSKL
eukprot:TRINITY_DN39820_c0_g1_i1.p1 TRINITY_DN39820_c0_g1~~TRINITY_DN39820_c0_g1_i1.p1  ORF type:complete len:260 (-),score=76.95 TRINITY_DN39820_c0_g1_i1:48-827(-)